jgi:transcription elongation GreA/GreB family factor
MKNTPSKFIFLSRKGMKEFKKTISRLEHDKKRALIELKELDKSTAREERLIRAEKLAGLEIIELELAEKKQLLPRLRPLPTKRARLKVVIGSAVDLIDQQGRLFRYIIVDSLEANPSDGRISALSPLGSRLIGKTLHDIVEWSSGLKTRQLQLVQIS